jgi:Ca-activated chloride channel homolog
MRTVIRRRLIAAIHVICLAPLALIAAFGTIQAAEPSTTIIVFDGSGSMWGKLDGEKQTKLVLARDAISASLGKFSADARLGLASFGHRRQADCTDVQVIVSPEANTTERITGALEKHNPRGKGPLTLALKEAAKSLGSAAGSKNLILVHDDPDNCQQNVCAALGDLQMSAPGVRISVVGLGLKADDAQRYVCLTKPTGGKLFDAQNGVQITSGIDEAMRLAALNEHLSSATLPVASQSQSAPPASPSRTNPTKSAESAGDLANQRVPLVGDGPSALRLAAVLAPGLSPHPHSVRWSVSPAATDAAPVFTGSGQDLIVPLPPGDYIIDAQDGLIRSTQRVTVGAIGQTNGDVVLNAGLLRVNLTDTRDAASAAQTTLTVFEAGSSATLKPIGVQSAHDETITLPAASYLIRLQRGPQVVDRRVAMVAGRTEALDVALSTATLSLAIAQTPAAANTRTSEPQPLTVFTIYEDDPDQPKGRREVTRSVAPEPDFVLMPGTYYIVAQQGLVEARDRISLSAGETARRVLALQPARLKLSSRLPTAPATPTIGRDGAIGTVGYRIERLDVVPPEVFTVNQAISTLLLPAGRYRIEAQHGRVNARATRDITIGPGEAQDVIFEQKAGLAQFRLSKEAQTQAVDVFWELRDESGRSIWATVQSGPTAILQAGRYTVVAELRDKRIEQSFEIKTGETRTIEMAP